MITNQVDVNPLDGGGNEVNTRSLPSSKFEGDPSASVRCVKDQMVVITIITFQMSTMASITMRAVMFVTTFVRKY